MSSLYLIPNHAMQTTAAPSPVTTGTAIKTMLQLRPLTNLRIVEWGFSFSALALAAPVTVELIETGTVFATVTAHVEAGVTKINDHNAVAATMMTLSTTGTGYTSTAEGSITAVRNLDGPIQASVLSQPFVKQFPLGREPKLTIANSCRIRVTAGTAYNMFCYVVVEG
jgi:hypothetical protein